ncbi:MAG: hypothetical protein AB7U79_00100 [Candidatus Izemoplasmatales bacterium]
MNKQFRQGSFKEQIRYEKQNMRPYRFRFNYTILLIIFPLILLALPAAIDEDRFPFVETYAILWITVWAVFLVWMVIWGVLVYKRELRDEFEIMLDILSVDIQEKENMYRFLIESSLVQVTFTKEGFEYKDNFYLYEQFEIVVNTTQQYRVLSHHLHFLSKSNDIDFQIEFGRKTYQMVKSFGIPVIETNAYYIMKSDPLKYVKDNLSKGMLHEDFQEMTRRKKEKLR